MSDAPPAPPPPLPSIGHEQPAPKALRPETDRNGFIVPGPRGPIDLLQDWDE
jgi:hypothetical protein